ncbi:MAG TPA: hypothetical protein VM580_21775 [Labilithrix sp.]|nr:hypothetical protein [Labilithrix sp.]
MKRSGTIVVLSLLSALAFPACASEAVDSGASADSDLVARVLADSAAVYDDSLVFPSALVPSSLRERIVAFQGAIASGKKREEIENVILVGDRSKNAVDVSGKIRPAAGNPFGYLRRALSIRDEGGKTIIQTERASLEEAFAELKASEVIEIGTASSAAAVLPLVTKQYKKSIPLTRFDDIEMFNVRGSTVRLGSGFVSLDVGLGLGAEISDFRLKHVHVNFDAKFTSEFMISAKVEPSVVGSGEQVLSESKWPLGTIGPVPATLSLRVVAKCDVVASGRARAKTDVRATLGVSAGFAYDSGEGVKFLGEGVQFEPARVLPQIETAGTAEVKCVLAPEMSVFLFDGVGPTLSPFLLTRVEASGPPLRTKIFGGAGGSAAFHLQVFGRELARADKSLGSFERNLWSYGEDDLDLD